MRQKPYRSYKPLHRNALLQVVFHCGHCSLNIDPPAADIVIHDRYVYVAPGRSVLCPHCRHGYAAGDELNYAIEHKEVHTLEPTTPTP